MPVVTMLMKRIKPYLSGDYLKSMLTLVSGSVIAQLITILLVPVTTRLFSPVELGVYTLVASATTMFGSVLSLRYDFAVVYEHDDRLVYPLIVLSALICLISSVLVSVGYFIYFSFFSTIGISSLLAAFFVFLTCFPLGIVNILNSYNNRMREYRCMTNAAVARSFAQNSGIVVSGLAGFGEIGLLLAQTLGYLFGIRSQAKTLFSHFDEIASVSHDSLGEVAKLHKSQAVWSAPATFANGFSYSSINYFIEQLYGAAAVGFYSISFRVLGMPLTLISGNMARVFAERAANDKKELGNFRAICTKTIFMMIVMSVPVGLVLMFAAPALCGLIFGEDWVTAGVYIRIMTPMFMLRFIAGGVNGATMISGKQHIDFAIQTVLAICAIVSFALSVLWALSIENMLLLISVLFSIVYVVYIALFWYCSL